jgi:hypothetical protein
LGSNWNVHTGVVFSEFDEDERSVIPWSARKRTETGPASKAGRSKT